MSINKNMLREVSQKLPEVTDSMWMMVLAEHRELVDEFLEVNAQLSPQSKSQYRSGLRQWIYYIHKHLEDKPLYKITKRDFLKYMSYLQSRNMSSSALSFKKATASSLNNYIETVLVDDDERYSRFRNFTKNLPQIAKNQVYSKSKITKEEYSFIMSTLLAAEDYLGAAWVATSFNVGGRRSETIQFKSEILKYPLSAGQSYVMSHPVRLKGRGTTGKIDQFMVNLEALKYMQLWVSKRGYDHEYIFTVKRGAEIQRMPASWANNFCADKLTPMLGRRINPHLFKSSCITYLLECGVDIALVSKFVAQHENVSTTISHYDLRDFAEQKAKIFTTSDNSSTD